MGVVRLPGTTPTVTFDPTPPPTMDFNSPSIDAYASVRLQGATGEDLAGWTLGFVQLKYIGTNHSRYRGATERQGSAFVTGSNQTLCRDTDTPPAGQSPEVWYDSLTFGGTTGPTGTNRLAVGTLIPAAGYLDVKAHLYDQPDRHWPPVEPNTAVTGKPDTFLRYTVVELLFCTLLVAQEPGGKFHVLKHFYWNVICEHTFTVDRAGAVVPDQPIRMQHNIQKPVHSGSPNDKKFSGKEFDVTLPVSNTVSRLPPHKFYATDWKYDYRPPRK
jgi:hypothetical protein